MTWSAAQYLKFEEERTRPVRDLVQRIPLANVESAADIGCGPGNSTEVLRQRYPGARIVGIDSSAGHDRGGAQAPSRNRFRGRGHSRLAARRGRST